MKQLGAHILAAAVLAAAAAPGAAFAQRYAPAPPPNYYQQNESCPTGYSLQQQDRAAYDCSGTRGRMGLGASPLHPEGPGNVSNFR